MCFFFSQIRKCRTSPWGCCAAQTSQRWPGAWSTPWPRGSHAHVTERDGMLSFSGSHCHTCLHLWLTLWWKRSCHAQKKQKTTEKLLSLSVEVARVSWDKLGAIPRTEKVSKLHYKIGNLFVCVSAAENFSRYPTFLSSWYKKKTVKKTETSQFQR